MAHWLIKRKVFYNLDASICMQAVHTLTVGSPGIVIITLLRIKPWPVKYRPVKGTKVDIDMRKLGRLCLRLRLVAVVPTQQS